MFFHSCLQRKKTLYCVNKDKSPMLVHLLKFMRPECGCNRAHRALKGGIYAETYSFPSSLCLCSLRQRGRALSCHYEGSRGKRETKWFPGFALIWRGRGGTSRDLVTGSCFSWQKRDTQLWETRICKEPLWVTVTFLHDAREALLWRVPVPHTWLNTCTVTCKWIYFTSEIIVRTSVFHALFLSFQPQAAIRTMHIVMSDSHKPLQFWELYQGMIPTRGWKWV